VPFKVRLPAPFPHQRPPQVTTFVIHAGPTRSAAERTGASSVSSRDLYVPYSITALLSILLAKLGVHGWSRCFVSHLMSAGWLAVVSSPPPPTAVLTSFSLSLDSPAPPFLLREYTRNGSLGGLDHPSSPIAPESSVFVHVGGACRSRAS
jgi:hypothetical protein